MVDRLIIYPIRKLIPSKKDHLKAEGCRPVGKFFFGSFSEQSLPRYADRKIPMGAFGYLQAAIRKENQVFPESWIAGNYPNTTFLNPGSARQGWLVARSFL